MLHLLGYTTMWRYHLCQFQLEIQTKLYHLLNTWTLFHAYFHHFKTCRWLAVFFNYDLSSKKQKTLVDCILSFTYLWVFKRKKLSLKNCSLALQKIYFDEVFIKHNRGSTLSILKLRGIDRSLGTINLCYSILLYLHHCHHIWDWVGG